MKCIGCAVLFTVSLCGQVIIESAILTGTTSAAAAASAHGIAKALSGALGSVEKTTKAAADAKPVLAVVPEKPLAPVKLPVVSQIAAGITREDLLAKFGEPSQKMTIPEGSHLSERYRYDVGKDFVKVILEDGKVKEVVASGPAVALPPNPL